MRKIDLLQKGREQVAAGYIIYCSSTIMVFFTGEGVHGFTLDPSVGDFFFPIRISEYLTRVYTSASMKGITATGMKICSAIYYF